VPAEGALLDIAMSEVVAATLDPADVVMTVPTSWRAGAIILACPR
jgi:hypothetical protein